MHINIQSLTLLLLAPFLTLPPTNAAPAHWLSNTPNLLKTEDWNCNALTGREKDSPKSLWNKLHCIAPNLYVICGTGEQPATYLPKKYECKNDQILEKKTGKVIELQKRAFEEVKGGFEELKKLNALWEERLRKEGGR